MMRLIDADAFDKCLEGAEIEATKNQKYVFSSAINTIRGNLANAPTIEPQQWISCDERLPKYGQLVFREIFGCDTDKMDYRDYKSKYEAWQKQKDEIKVGDEVNPINDTWRGVVVNVDNGDLTIMGSRGISSNGYESKYFSKTGRHFPEVAELLRKMRGEAE